MRNFNSDSYVGFGARVVTTADQKKIADKIISTWHTQIKNIEKLTIEKISRVSNYGESLIHLATMVNDSKTIRWLADNKADLNKLNDGESAVFDAVYFGSGDALRTLADNGADLGTFNDQDMTPLMYAAFFNRYELVHIFAKNNPQLINKQNKKLLSALHFAVAKKHYEFIKKLIEY